jgi:hypothetical protein
MKRTALFCVVAGCVLWASSASRPGLAEGRRAHPLRASPSAQTTPPRARSPADTTRRRVKAGEVLITTLPAQVSGRRVVAYDLLRAPALSDLAGRSFFWRTRPETRTGRHRLLFRARFDTTVAPRNAPADTLALIVRVTSSD